MSSRSIFPFDNEDDPDDGFGLNNPNQTNSGKKQNTQPKGSNNNRHKIIPISHKEGNRFDSGKSQHQNHNRYENDNDRNMYNDNHSHNGNQHNNCYGNKYSNYNSQSTKKQISNAIRNQSSATTDSLQSLQGKNNDKGVVKDKGVKIFPGQLKSKKTFSAVEKLINAENSIKNVPNAGYSMSASDIKPKANITADFPHLSMNKSSHNFNNNNSRSNNPPNIYQYHKQSQNSIPKPENIPKHTTNNRQDGKSSTLKPPMGKNNHKDKISMNAKQETQSKKRLQTEDLTDSPEPKKLPRSSNRTPKVPEIVDLLDDSDDDGDDDDEMDVDTDLKENSVEQKFGQPPVVTVSINNLYLNEICKTNGTSYSVQVHCLPPNVEIRYINDNQPKQHIDVPLNLMEKINHGHCIDSDDLGFIELCKLSSHEEINGIEKDLFIAKATNISSILEQLRILTIDRNDFCFNEITDPYEIQTIMSADIANKLQLEENNPKKRKSRRSSAVSFAENPEDTEIYIVYPIETDASDPINITKGCMKRLNEGEYLNDNLIDYKIKVLLEQLKVTNEYKREKIHAFSCQFYIKLTEKRNPKEMFEMVARWTKDIDIFELDFLFVPVNIGSHWSLSVIVRPGLILQKNSKELTISSGGSFEEIEDNLPCIMFMDSLNLHNMTTISKQLRSYVEFEYNVKKLKIDINSINLNKRNFGASNSQQDNSQLVLNAENFPVIKCAVPQQPNGTDCGVYVIRFFQLIINQWPKSGKAQQDDKMKEFIRRNSFDHDEIVNMRLNIKEEIKSLKDEFDKNRRLFEEMKQREKKERRKQKLQAHQVSTGDNNDNDIDKNNENNNNSQISNHNNTSYVDKNNESNGNDSQIFNNYNTVNADKNNENNNDSQVSSHNTSNDSNNDSEPHETI